MFKMFNESLRTRDGKLYVSIKISSLLTKKPGKLITGLHFVKH
jgi:hypothetical protein